MDIEKFPEYVEQLIDGIDRGHFGDTERIPDDYTYEHLFALYFAAGMLSGGVELYRKMHHISEQCAIANLKKKVNEGEKINTLFWVYSAAEWQAESVYRKMSEDNRFDVRIIVMPAMLRPYEARRRSYKETYNFFSSHGYRMMEVYDGAIDCSISWTDLGYMPDIVFNLNAYVEEMPESMDIMKLPLHCLQIYIPYCMYLPDNEERTYLKDAVYTKPIFNIMHRVYMESERHKEGFISFNMMRGRNVRYSGFPKMDFFYERHEYQESDIRTIWKIPDHLSIEKMKRVIIAPHHSMSPEHIIQFSTFMYNAFFLLYMAKKYSEEVTFIYKPHPNVRMSAVENGLFKSYEEYDAYVAKWDELPNARSVTEESYLDIFATSDAMIMDCASFIGEYLYVNKPLLFLTRKGQAFGSGGEKIMKAYYQSPGVDYVAIEDFLRNVVMGGNDVKAHIRKKVLKEELDYVAKNGMKAGEVIYRDITSLIEGDVCVSAEAKQDHAP